VVKITKKFLAITMVLVLAAGFAAIATEAKPLTKKLGLSWELHQDLGSPFYLGMDTGNFEIGGVASFKINKNAKEIPFFPQFIGPYVKTKIVDIGLVDVGFDTGFLMNFPTNTYKFKNGADIMMSVAPQASLGFSVDFMVTKSPSNISAGLPIGFGFNVDF